MHRGQRAVRHRDQLAEPVALVQDGEDGRPSRSTAFCCARRRARATLRCSNGRRVQVEKTKSCGLLNLERSLWQLRIAASSPGIGTVRTDPSVLVGRTLPWRPTWHANSTSASSRSEMWTFVHLRAESSETRAPVSAASVNSVLQGSPAAAIVCSSSPPSNKRRFVLCPGFGRSEGSRSETGLVPAQPRRRAAYR